eukprot:evm.model.scf_612.1 EVM.evm.TU.scf_612.1   scf_612:7259-10563(+)
MEMGARGLLVAAALVCALAAVPLATADEVAQSTAWGAGARVLLQDTDDRPPPLQCGDRTAYSYAVSLMSARGSFLCGGALIRKNWVLTAAQCVDVSFRQKAEMHPRINIAGRTAGTAVQTLRTIATFVPLQWNGNPRNGYDVALLKLEKAACMDPIPIADQEFNMMANESLLYLGWGRFGGGGAFSDVLQAADMVWISNDDCSERLVENEVTRQMLCAKGVTTQGLCAGDEGSPLVYSPIDPVHKVPMGPFTLVGVASFSDEKCTEPNSISLFTSVPKLSKWILKTIKRENEKEKGRQ